MISIKMADDILEIAPSKIICLLRTYAAHARELDNPLPERPRFFLKPPSSLLENGGEVVLPAGLSEVHHEVELAVIIGMRGKNIPLDSAKDHILAYTVMLDITARTLQQEARSEGLPWSEAKGFDTFAPIGPEAVPAGDFDWRDKLIWLDVNGVRKQEATTGLLIFTVEDIISSVSKVMTLEPGDIIMTGTPSGVGPLEAGDEVDAGIDGINPLNVSVNAG